MARCAYCGGAAPVPPWCYSCEVQGFNDVFMQAKPSRFIVGVRTAAILSILGWLLIGGALGLLLS